MTNWFSTEVPKEFKEKRIIFSTNDTGITGYPHAKVMIHNHDFISCKILTGKHYGVKIIDKL